MGEVARETRRMWVSGKGGHGCDVDGSDNIYENLYGALLSAMSKGCSRLV